MQWWGNTERILYFIKTKISRGRLGTLLDFLLMLLRFTIIFTLKYKVWRHNNLFRPWASSKGSTGMKYSNK